MPMSGGPTLAAESWNATELLAAGWTEADLGWEQAAEQSVEAVAANDFPRAKEQAGSALRIARENFEPIDPRLGTSLANFAVCLKLSGDADVAGLLREALDVWRGAGPWIARMDAPRVARSSLFHMRMEARHRETYRERWQVRWQEIATEAVAKLEMLNKAPAVVPTIEGPKVLARWRRERPAMLNDTRKLMAAGFLLLAPPSPVSQE
jgi:hypothetical protein